MADYDYDLYVIGAGSGGVRAARIAAGYGAKVAVAEEYRVGGTCVIRGCVPKKLFAYAAHFHEDFEDSAAYGWTLSDPKFDWTTLLTNKNKEIDRLNGIYIRNLKRAGVEIHDTRATIKDPHTVHLVAEGRDVTAKYILVAVGGWPQMPDVPGIEHAITSNEAFHLKEFPESVLVVGGGYIAVEFAGIFHGLGAKTTLSYRGPVILRGFDMDLRVTLQDEMEKKGINVQCESRIVAIEKGQRNGGKPCTIVQLEDGTTLDYDLVMYATGRTPNTKGLGLENAGVSVADNGAIRIDQWCRTNVASIYAVGDVTDRLQLTPVAIREGHAFADTVFGGKPVKVEYDSVATAVFSHPPIGTVGLTEEEARERYDEIDIYKSSFRPLKYTLSGRDERTVMKLVVDAVSQRVVGCHIIGLDAPEMIQCVGIAVKMGATKADFDATVAVHPTAAEELVTLREKFIPPKE
jgi:glutathione reductase (NADPH)